MKSYGAFEAKNRLSELLARVELGEEIVITRHGHAVARLVPIAAADGAGAQRAIERIKALRRQNALGDVDLKELVNAGRRY
jgi:prevent-host-death family protein